MEISEFSMDFFSLAGKKAIVTGGNTGLGQAFSLALAKAGADVFVPSVMDDDGKTGPLIAAAGRRYEYLKIDITAPGAAAKVIDTCVERFGAVDILVNSAGICPMAEVLDFGRPQWDATVAVNLTAAFELSYEAAKKMIPQKSGKIINICSLFSFLGGRWSSAYAATKHGLAGFTKAYCDELAMHNIQVNGIAPGLLRHRDHAQDAQQSGNQPARARPHPGRTLGRAGRPHGCAGLPVEPRLQLRQRSPARRRRRLPGALTRDGDPGALHRRRRQRLAEHEGRDLRPRGQCSRGRPAGAARCQSPAPRRRRTSRRRPVGFDRRCEPAGAGELPGRSTRDHRRRALHHPLLQGVPAGRWLARAAGHELDGHARLPAVHAGRSGGGVCDHLLRLHHAPLHRRVQGHRGQQHPAAVADRHRHVAMEQRSGAAAAVQRPARATVRTAAARRDRGPRDRRGGRGHRNSGGTAGRRDGKRQGRRGARLRLARRAHRAHLARHLHRVDGAR